ncbi:hypothetical protein LTS18_009969, partial [Coniosporium uncinatum]
VRGGSPWGAGTFSGGDGSRMPSDKELELARKQGEAFYGAVRIEEEEEGEEGAGREVGSGAPAAKAQTTLNGGQQQQQQPRQQQITGSGGRGRDGTQSNIVERKEEDEKGGPCGLPGKCVLL